MSYGEYVYMWSSLTFQCHLLVGRYRITILLHYSRLLGSQALSVSYKGF